MLSTGYLKYTYFSNLNIKHGKIFCYQKAQIFEVVNIRKIKLKYKNYYKRQ